MIGKTISHYKILEKLGEGGMGVVYLAEDNKLKRKVALKFLPREMTFVEANGDSPGERFIREAQAAAALNHPNIVTIHEINEFENQAYIAMEYVEGQTLKEMICKGEVTSPLPLTSYPLPLTKILDYTTQICEGLQAAHKAGIVHRDIKPQNIIIDKEGRVKILDFGLAKLKGIPQLTRESSTLGTVSYMSPEQSIGKKIDHRTDIWSLGVVLYEMITGQLPFKGDYEQAIIYSILNENPEPVTSMRTGVLQDLERAVNKTLIKDPLERYQHVDDLTVDLRRLKKDSKPEVFVTRKKSSPEITLKAFRKVLILGSIFIVAIIIAGYFILKGKPEPEPPSQTISQTEKIKETSWKNSVAVLPFRDFSPKKDQDYFCDGMTDAIIGKLSHLKQLKIISLTSVLQYKNQARNIKKIGRELDVITILEGTIQKEGEKIRVNAQLINVADDSHLWQKTYNSELKSLFTIQDEISQSIANALRIELLREEKKILAKHHTQNTDAYKLYMQGRFFWRKRTQEGFKKSIELYERALKVDPAYALAYSGLADTYSNIAWSLRYLPQKQGLFTQAKEAALKAIKLDDNLAEAHNSLAYIKLDYEWNFEEAKKEFEQAIYLNPGYANAYHWYARYFVYKGNLQKAIYLTKRALELNPLSPSFNYFLAALYYWARRYNQAIILLKRGIDMHPDFTENHYLLGGIYLTKAMYEKAMDEYEIYESPLRLKFFKLVIESLKGNKKKLAAFLDKYANDKVSANISLFEKALAYACAGNIEKVFEWLEKAYETRDPQILFFRVYPHFNKYHTDDRYKNLLKKMGLDK